MRNHGQRAGPAQSIEEFERDLKKNLYRIWNRMSSGSYFPPPVRTVKIPKANGGERRLGIPTVSANLKERRSAGIDTLLLREQDRGTFSIAREWTDWADPSPYGALGLPPRRLDADSLFELAALLDQLTKPEQKG